MIPNAKNLPEIVFFGSSELSVIFLEKLKELGILPKLIVTFKDKPAGRGLKITQNPVALWAQENSVPVLKTEKLNDEFVESLTKHIDAKNSLFFVYAYGKIIPEKIFNLPKYKTLNYHPSLLPKLRGPSPIRSAILQNIPEYVGGTIIQLDSKMDHGPILIQEKFNLKSWPVCGSWLDRELSEFGAELFAKALPEYLQNPDKLTPQNHSEATYTTFFSKQDGLLELNQDPYQNYLKICALEGWPGTFFYCNGKRVKVEKAQYKDGKLILQQVKPEGKKAMSFQDFKRGYNCSEYDIKNL